MSQESMPCLQRREGSPQRHLQPSQSSGIDVADMASSSSRKAGAGSASQAGGLSELAAVAAAIGAAQQPAASEAAAAASQPGALAAPSGAALAAVPATMGTSPVPQAQAELLAQLQMAQNNRKAREGAGALAPAASGAAAVDPALLSLAMQNASRAAQTPMHAASSSVAASQPGRPPGAAPAQTANARPSEAQSSAPVHNGPSPPRGPGRPRIYPLPQHSSQANPYMVLQPSRYPMSMAPRPAHTLAARPPGVASSGTATPASSQVRPQAPYAGPFVPQAGQPRPQAALPSVAPQLPASQQASQADMHQLALAMQALVQSTQGRPGMPPSSQASFPGMENVQAVRSMGGMLSQPIGPAQPAASTGVQRFPAAQTATLAPSNTPKQGGTAGSSAAQPALINVAAKVGAGGQPGPSSGLPSAPGRVPSSPQRHYMPWMPPTEAPSTSSQAVPGPQPAAGQTSGQKRAAGTPAGQQPGAEKRPRTYPPLANPAVASSSLAPSTQLSLPLAATAAASPVPQKFAAEEHMPMALRVSITHMMSGFTTS